MCDEPLLKFMVARLCASAGLWANQGSSGWQRARIRREAGKRLSGLVTYTFILPTLSNRCTHPQAPSAPSQPTAESPLQSPPFPPTYYVYRMKAVDRNHFPPPQVPFWLSDYVTGESIHEWPPPLQPYSLWSCGSWVGKVSEGGMISMSTALVHKCTRKFLHWMKHLW